MAIDIHTLRINELISGQALRNYRQRISACAGGDSAILSMKMGLEFPQNESSMTFEKCRQTYEVVEGVGLGSLTYFLFTVLLSGFRIFPSNGEACKFAERSVFESQDFAQATKEAFGEDVPKFTPGEIVNRLKKLVRSSKGKSNAYNVDVIRSEFRKSLAPKVQQSDNEDKFDEIFGAIANALLPFESWKTLSSRYIDACAVVDEVLSRFASFPSLAEMCRRNNNHLPKKTTIAYDVRMRKEMSESNISPYAVVANFLADAQNDGVEKKDRVKYVQERVSTANGNGLSWLFGNGLIYWRTTPINEIASDYGVPLQDMAYVKRVHAAALALPEQSLLHNGTKAMAYSAFRSSLAGKIDSWVNNYISRLAELEKMLDDLNVELKLPKAFVRNGVDFLDTTDCKRQEIEELFGAFAQIRQKAKNSVSRLLGCQENGDSIQEALSEVRECTGIINRLKAVFNQIENALNQTDKDEKSEWKGLSKDVSEELELWKKLKKLPKINDFSGGVPDVEKELKQELVNYAEVECAWNKHWKRVCEWIEANAVDTDELNAQERTESKHIHRSSREIEYDVKELAVRKLLDQVGKLVRGRDDDCARSIIQWFGDKQIFAKQKLKNQYFCNRLGSLYVSPFSNKRHKGYDLGHHVVEQRKELWEDLRRLIEAKKVKPFTQEAETLLKLKNLMYSKKLSAIDVPIPSEVATPELGKFWDDAVSEDLKLQLKQTMVSAGVLSKSFNTYTSLLQGSSILLRRERFFLRTKFTWVANNELVYRPKAVTWRIPDRYRQNDDWKSIFDSGILVCTPADEVDVKKTFAKLAENHDSDHLRKLLRQLPHDWCYRLPFESNTNAGDPIEVLKVSKDGSQGTKLSSAKYPADSLARLVGPSSMKSRLDELLINPTVTVGDMTVLVDQPMDQCVTESGVEIRPLQVKCSLSIPVKRSFNDLQVEKTAPFTRIVAIDQGEAGLGYAVFNLSDAGQEMAAPVTCGMVPIRSIRRLIKAVRSYRKSGQSAQKFNQRFDSTMFTIRENVAGDVCGVIAGLMSRFNAIPILEKDVKNLESGSKQLPLVYKMVNNRFLVADSDMPNAERKSWWMGSAVWNMDGCFATIGTQPVTSTKTQPVRHDDGT